ncbi:MAG: fibronectin type III domain-containing protein [Elusimicrobia bacterium]|nr:fibronectin type III domain-containing protein [Elusimicrobiota bacterium]
MFRQKLIKVCGIFALVIFTSISFLSGVSDTTPPAKITYFLTAFPTPKTITLVWRSVGDDGNTGTATKYDIRYSLSPITTEAGWNSATKVKCDLTPNPAGSAESFIVFGLSPSTKYYFAIKACDKVPNWSPLSKSPGTTTPAITDTTPPGKITDLTASNPTPKSIMLTWTAPGNDDNSKGKAARYLPQDINHENLIPQSQLPYRPAARYIPYDIRYSLTPITDANWDSATKVKEAPAAQEIFKQEKFTIPGLSPSTKYYFAIKTADEVPNWSKVSNSPNETTKPKGVAVPYKGVPFQIPGKIEAEDYDTGGEETSYHDTTTGNAASEGGSTYRTTEDVDVEPCTDADGGYNVGWAVAGEWLKYTTNISNTGIYMIEVRVACGGNGGTFHIEFDDLDKTGPMTVPDTGGWQIYQTVRKTGVNLIAGKHIMKLAMDTNGYPGATGNFNYINIIREGNLGKTDTVAPSAIASLVIGNVTGNSVLLSWTSPGNDGNSGTASVYDIRYATMKIDNSNWSSATQCVGEPTPQISGSKQTYTVQHLRPNTKYYFAIKTADEVPNWSPLSNSPCATTSLSVTVPNEKMLFYEGSIFPNPNLAPINPPYLISWRDGPGEQPHETVNYFGYKWATKSQHDEMIAKGKLPIPFSYACRDDASQKYNQWYLDTEEKMYNNYLKIAQEGYYGIEIDEYSAWDSDMRAKKSINALRHVKQQYPNLFMDAALYGDGMDEIIASGADILNLYELEIYIYPGFKDYRTYIKKWTDWIKYYGLEGKTIGILGGGDDYNGNAPDVDLWIKYLRAESPQMAGLGLGIFKLYNLTTAERTVYDKVMDDNFFKISPSVSITAPTKNAKLSGTVKIAVIATKNPETGNPVVSYRYFIDTKLVKISSSPEYLWNTTGYSKGKHIITVHAVADDYLAGVSQVNVMLNK